MWPKKDEDGGGNRGEGENIWEGRAEEEDNKDTKINL